MQTQELIYHLIETSRIVSNKVEELKKDDIQNLKKRPAPNSWNVLECIEHLNRYGDYYLPAIENALNNSKNERGTEFKSGILGAYSAKSMLPNEKLNKMKTFKDKDPIHCNLDKSVLDKFLHQQFQLIELLNRALQHKINKIKIPTSISKLIRMNLGDTFRFYINHILRHIQQIENIKTQTCV